jgi:threonyl-tRNA synthetase
MMESLRRHLGVKFEISPGDGVYGPKIEYTLKDAIGRQCGTIQVDSMPERLDAEYVGGWARHRSSCCTAPLSVVWSGSSGILIEEHAGARQLGWRQTRSRFSTLRTRRLNTEKLLKRCRIKGLGSSDLRNEKITYKIRDHSVKLPYILVVGDKEMAAGTVAVRARGEDLERDDINRLLNKLFWTSRKKLSMQSWLWHKPL